MINTDYLKQAKIIIKTEMVKADVNYPKLAELLKEIDVDKRRENLANKINRGKFSFAFALQVFKILGCKNI